MKSKKLQLHDAEDGFLKIQEMQGYHGLKMKKEALRVARFFLEKPGLSLEQFLKSLEVVDEFTGKATRWLALLEAAYCNLNLRSRENARTRMMLFCARKRYTEATIRYFPQRITHKTGLVELMIVWEFWLENSNMDELEKTIPIISRAIHTAAYADMSAWLSKVYARYWARKADLVRHEQMKIMKQDYLNKSKGK